MNTVNPSATLIDFAPRESTNVEQTPALVIDNQEVLLQGLGLLFDLRNGTYSEVVAAPHKASIGQHLSPHSQAFLVFDPGSAFGRNQLRCARAEPGTAR
jgi:hypothetical protein